MKHTAHRERDDAGARRPKNYHNELEKIGLLGRQRCPHVCRNFATSPPSLGAGVGGGGYQKKNHHHHHHHHHSLQKAPATCLLKFLRHSANIPLPIRLFLDPNLYPPFTTATSNSLLKNNKFSRKADLENREGKKHRRPPGTEEAIEGENVAMARMHNRWNKN
jgi:hypothetical protein